jgi:hypothetical protein
MNKQCLHQETIEITTFCDRHHMYLCRDCFWIGKGDLIQPVNQAEAHQQELENERQVVRWAANRKLL